MSAGYTLSDIHYIAIKLNLKYMYPSCYSTNSKWGFKIQFLAQLELQPTCW